MKIPLQQVDHYGEKFSEGSYDSLLDIKEQIAKLEKCSVSDIYIYEHLGVGEWVINVKGQFFDYVIDRDLTEGFWRDWYEITHV